MSDALDLSLSPRARAERLAERLKTLIAEALGVGDDALVLFSSPEEAGRALQGAAVSGWRDRTEEGGLALDAVKPGEAALYRVGPLHAPVCVFAARGRTSALNTVGAPAPPAIALQAALDGLSPGARLKARGEARERARALKPVLDWLQDAFGADAVVVSAQAVTLKPVDLQAAADRLGAHGVLAQRDDAVLRLWVGDAQAAARLARRLGFSRAGRSASVRRTTKETDIALVLDLDGEGGAISTGVHFFDHMLEQIARHAGVGLEVSCIGDVEVDAHHTVEDVCLAFGEALREALGDKRGITRFGFALPMDETRASVWIDLSGRPYFRFDGAIPGERVGDFPVEMAPHAFRSISESLKASIHVEVDGENAHHMIESCFKAFGRALRQAVAIEGDALPSTKGVL